MERSQSTSSAGCANRPCVTTTVMRSTPREQREPPRRPSPVPRRSSTMIGLSANVADELHLTRGPSAASCERSRQGGSGPGCIAASFAAPRSGAPERPPPASVRAASPTATPLRCCVGLAKTLLPPGCADRGRRGHRCGTAIISATRAAPIAADGTTVLARVAEIGHHRRQVSGARSVTRVGQQQHLEQMPSTVGVG
jgi:hypothetical protein